MSTSSSGGSGRAAASTSSLSRSRVTPWETGGAHGPASHPAGYWRLLPRWVDHGSMPPDLACYEERCRLTGGAALGLAASLLSIGLGFLWHTPVVFAALAVILAALTVTMPGGGVIAAARRVTAFRADHAGITLGAVPGKLSGRGPAVFIPWADVERIVLYPAARRGQGTQAQCLGVQRREGAPPLPRGNEQAPGCPVPGVAAGASRRITGWRLDRERLAAVTVAVATGIPIVDASTIIPSPCVEGPGQAANAP